MTFREILHNSSYKQTDWIVPMRSWELK